MEQQPPRQPVKKSPLALAFNIFVVLLILGAIGQVFQARGLTHRIAELESQRAAANKKPADDPNYNAWSTVVKSGKGGFQVTLPDGWGPVTNVTASDFLIMPGRAQPTLAAGSAVKVIEAEGYGTDSPSLFSIMLVNKGEAAPPQGTAEEFNFSNNKNGEPIKGKKYSYAFSSDQLAGIGYLRPQGDRDYEYIVPFGDQELHVRYSVYGSDPRNLIETVDAIVQTITLAKTSAADL